MVYRQFPFEIEDDVSPMEAVWVLGWYTWEGADGTHHHSEIGALMNQAKYRSAPTLTSEEAFANLSEGLCALVRETSPLSECTSVVAVPGSGGTTDFAGRLAEDVARGLGLRMARIRSVRLDRTSRKEKKLSMLGAFTPESDLKGETVLLIDDVYEEGATMRAAGQAAIKAGADRVMGVAAARKGSG